METVNQELSGPSLQEFLQGELTTLCRNLDDTYNVLSQKWISAELTSHLDKLQQGQQDKVQHYHEEIDSHEKNIKKIQGLASNNQKALEDQIQKLSALKQELRILTTQTQSALQQQEKLSSEISNSQQDIAARTEALKGSSEDTEKTQRDLELASKFFQDRLSLRFQKISGGRLQYCFSSVDRENPDNSCCFCLKVNSDRSYTVSDFSPEVEGFQELEQKLNATNDLRSFMVAIRKKFVKTVNSAK
ncbi:kinetochore protein Spc25-like [Saccostrea cucullata]|uniref:kinetochore protein Spc25-like n=1 Tax=Saccostrea cuccullata TaxID=36930 RepID=UPI002ED3D733